MLTTCGHSCGVGVGRRPRLPVVGLFDREEGHHSWAGLAEVAARFMHAEDSLQKVKEINKKFEIEFFRARHEIVDKQMREISASRTI